MQADRVFMITDKQMVNLDTFNTALMSMVGKTSPVGTTVARQRLNEFVNQVAPLSFARDVKDNLIGMNSESKLSSY